jgi:hypothetical protein
MSRRLEAAQVPRRSYGVSPIKREGVEMHIQPATALLPKVIFLSLLLLGRIASAAADEAVKSTLTLESVSPPVGDLLKQRTVIKAKLSYSVASFAPGKYFIGAQVEKNDKGRTTDGKFPNSGYAVLKQAQGDLTFSFPLKYVWDTPDVRHPLVVWLFLHEKTDQGHTRVVAKVGPLLYGQ